MDPTPVKLTIQVKTAMMARDAREIRNNFFVNLALDKITATLAGAGDRGEALDPCPVGWDDTHRSRAGHVPARDLPNGAGHLVVAHPDGHFLTHTGTPVASTYLWRDRAGFNRAGHPRHQPDPAGSVHATGAAPGGPGH